MSFKKNKYTIIRKAISKDLAIFIYNYFLIKRQVAQTLFNTKYISPFETMFGVWNDEQVQNTYSHYADIAMETLLIKVHSIMEKKTNLKLIPNYSYARIYKKGDILHRHKDRFSCEISTTLNLGGDSWPIFINPNEKEGYVFGEKRGVHGIQNYNPSSSKGIKVVLKPGDMLVYRGNLLEHWREKFEGEDCCQVFLHYNNIKTKGSEENIYDRRIHLGLPSSFKNQK
jgi:hypothetical protein